MSFVNDFGDDVLGDEEATLNIASLSIGICKKKQLFQSHSGGCQSDQKSLRDIEQEFCLR